MLLPPPRAVLPSSAVVAAVRAAAGRLLLMPPTQRGAGERVVLGHLAAGGLFQPRGAGGRSDAPPLLDRSGGPWLVPVAPPSDFASRRFRPTRRAFATTCCSAACPGGETGQEAAGDQAGPLADPFRPPANPYAALGLPMSASKAEVKRRYYEIAKECHPDTAAIYGGSTTPPLAGGATSRGGKTDSRRFLRAKTAYEMIVHQKWRPEPQLVRAANGYYTYQWPAEGRSDPEYNRVQRVAAYSAKWDRPTTQWWDAGEERRKKFCEEMASRNLEKTIYDPLEKFWRSWRRARPNPEATARGEVADVAPPEWWLRFLKSVLLHAEGSSVGLICFGLFAGVAVLTTLVRPGDPSPGDLPADGVNGRWVLVPAAVARRLYPRLGPDEYVVTQPRVAGTPRGPL